MRKWESESERENIPIYRKKVYFHRKKYGNGIHWRRSTNNFRECISEAISNDLNRFSNEGKVKENQSFSGEWNVMGSSIGSVLKLKINNKLGARWCSVMCIRIEKKRFHFLLQLDRQISINFSSNAFSKWWNIFGIENRKRMGSHSKRFSTDKIASRHKNKKW